MANIADWIKSLFKKTEAAKSTPAPQLGVDAGVQKMETLGGRTSYSQDTPQYQVPQVPTPLIQKPTVDLGRPTATGINRGLLVNFVQEQAAKDTKKKLGYVPDKSTVSEGLKQFLGTGKRTSPITTTPVEDQLARGGAAIVGEVAGMGDALTFGFLNLQAKGRDLMPGEDLKLAFDVGNVAGNVAGTIVSLKATIPVAAKGVGAVLQKIPGVTKVAELMPKTFAVIKSGIAYDIWANLRPETFQKTAEENVRGFGAGFIEGAGYSIAGMEPSFFKSVGQIAAAIYTGETIKGSDEKEALQSAAVGVVFHSLLRTIFPPAQQAKAVQDDVQATLARSRQVLGVDAKATPEQIKSAYRKAIVQAHPDKAQFTGMTEQQATAKAQDLNKAYRAVTASFQFVSKAADPTFNNNSMIKEWENLWKTTFKPSQYMNDLRKNAPTVYRNLLLQTQGGFFVPAADIKAPVGQFSSRVDRVARVELDDSKATVSLGNLRASGESGFREGKLGSILKHDTVYQVMPELKNVDVAYGPLRDGLIAQYDPNTNRISMNSKYPNVDPRRVLLHETQHVIQAKSGRSPGGAKYELTEDEYNRLFTEVESRAVEERADMTPAQRMRSDPFAGPYATQGIKLPDFVISQDNSAQANYPTDPKGVNDLTTTVLQRIQGRDSVSKQFIDDQLKRQDIKKPERVLLQNILNTMGPKISVPEFTERVKLELLPLEEVVAGVNANSTYQAANGIEKKNRPADIQYTEIVYQSPVETDASYMHFGSGAGAAKEIDRYFAHVRREEWGDVREIIEIQSDLFQHGNVKNEQIEENALNREAEVSRLTPYRNTWQDRILKEEIKNAARQGKKTLRVVDGKTALRVQYGTHAPKDKSSGKWVILDGDNVRIATREDIKTGALLEDVNEKNWIVTSDELLNQMDFYAIELDTLYRNFPKLRGDELIQEGAKWANRTGESEIFNLIPPEQVPPNTEDPLFSFYENEIPKSLRRLKPDMRHMEDENGVTWWEVEIKPPDADAPIVAFKKAKPKVNVDVVKRQDNTLIDWPLPPEWVPARGKPTWNHAKKLWNLMRNQYGEVNAMKTDVVRNPSIGHGFMQYVIDRLSSDEVTKPLEEYFKMKTHANKPHDKYQYKKLYAMFKARDYDMGGYKEVVGRLLGVEPMVMTTGDVPKQAAPAEPTAPASPTLYRTGELNDPRGTGVFLTTDKAVAAQYKGNTGAETNEYKLSVDKIKEATNRWQLAKEIDPTWDKEKIHTKLIAQGVKDGIDPEQRLQAEAERRIRKILQKQGYQAVRYSGGVTDQAGEYQVFDAKNITPAETPSLTVPTPQELTPEQKAALHEKALQAVANDEIPDTANTGARGVDDALIREIEQLSKTPSPESLNRLKQIKTEFADKDNEPQADIVIRMWEQLGVAETPVSAPGVPETTTPPPAPPIAQPEAGDARKMRGYQESVQEEETTPEKIREQIGKDEADYYDPISNDTSFDEAQNIVDMGESQALEFARTTIDARMKSTVALLLHRDAMAAEDTEKALTLMREFGAIWTNMGQGVQILSNYAKLTPEGAMRYAEREVRAAQEKTPKRKANVKKDAADTKKQMDQANKDVADDVGKEIQKDLDETASMQRKRTQAPIKVDGVNPPAASNADQEGNAADQLAKRVIAQVATPKPGKESEAKKMIDTLFEVAKEVLPKKAEKPSTDPLEFITQAIQQRDLYFEVWDKAKVLVEGYAEISDEMIKALDDYFSYDPDRPFADTQLGRTVSMRIKELGIDVRRLVQEHYVKQSAATVSLVDRIVEQAGLERDQAVFLARKVQHKFEQVTAKAKISILRQKLGKRPERKKAALYQNILKLSNLGALESEDFMPLFAEKYGIPYLGVESADKITGFARAAQEAPEGSRARIVAAAQMLDAVAENIPATTLEKIATGQVIAQLLNPKTLIRNIVGNGFFSLMENVADIVGTGLDLPISLITGERSKVLPSTKAQYRGFVRGLTEGWEDVSLGIDTSTAGTRYDLPKRTFRTGPAAFLETMLNVGLRTTDRAASTAAYEGSLENQMRAAGTTTPTEDMKAIATQDAMYRTFQDENVLSQTFVSLKKIFNANQKWGLGSLIINYPKTPANLLARGIDYSPFGFVKALKPIIQNARGQEGPTQKEFVEDMSRAMVGTGLIALGYLLAKATLLSGEPEKDYDVEAAKSELGQSRFRINATGLERFVLSGFDPGSALPREGDTYMSYDWNQPMSLALAMGANMANQKLAQDFLTDAMTQLAAGTETLTNQPVLTGVQRFMRTFSDSNYGGPVMAVGDALLSLTEQFIPTILSQVANMNDTVVRNPYDPSPLKEAINRAMKKIPGLRNTLPEYLQPTGQPIPANDVGNKLYNTFLNPAFLNRYTADPVLKEIVDIYKASGETKQAIPRVARRVTINGVPTALNQDQINQYQKYVGVLAYKTFDMLLQSDTFQSLPDDARANQMADILTDINTMAKHDLFGHEVYGLRTVEKRMLDYGSVAALDMGIRLDLMGQGYDNTRVDVVDLMESGDIMAGVDRAMAWNKEADESLQLVMPYLIEKNPEEAKRFQSSVLFGPSELRSMAAGTIRGGTQPIPKSITTQKQPEAQPEAPTTSSGGLKEWINSQ